VSLVQALLSLQLMGVLTQFPVDGSQEFVVQALVSSQFLGVPTQVPFAWH